MITSKHVKIILAVLLLGCLLDLPYGYYQLIRFLAFAGFFFLAYQANKELRKNEQIIFTLLALLFQPFIKIALGRNLWGAVDILVALGLFITLAKRPKSLPD
jgi:cell shape-determining protein MreD